MEVKKFVLRFYVCQLLHFYDAPSKGGRQIKSETLQGEENSRKRKFKFMDENSVIRLE